MYSVITRACFPYFFKLNALYSELLGEGMKSLFICFTFYLLVACAHVNAICEPVGVRGNF